MNIHEYQAKELLSKFGVPVTKGLPAMSPEEAVKVAPEVDPKGPWVVKAQIHAGGRGKAGGVKFVTNLDDLKEKATEMFGKTLVTHQTGPEGKEVQRLYVQYGYDIEAEYYLGMLVDRDTKKIVIMASTEGGVDIEEVAEKTPEKIIKVYVDAKTGLLPFHARKVAFGLGFKGDTNKQCVKLVTKLYEAFTKLDASIVEINPLMLSEQGDLMCLDAKMNFDSNALYRQPEVLELRDLSEEDPMEVEASKSDLNYVKLDGNIACMVNGAGLAMATMDIIKLYGAEPANFLDVGGGATAEQVTAAFKLILSDPNVEGILINIFGGIMRCDVIAEGILTAAKQVDLNVPLVVRLEGTNVEEGKKLLAGSDLAIIPADNLNDAANKIVDAIKALAA